MKPLPALLVAVAAVSVTACSACTPRPPSAAPAASAAPLAVVASTSVYGDIVKAIGGDAVVVTSIITNPDRNPHEYEADAQTQLVLSGAQLVVENGGGYDDFVDKMLSSSSSSSSSSSAAGPSVVNVADLSGYDQTPPSGEFNEHLWYDFPTMVKLADRLGADLAAARPDQAAAVTANTKRFTEQLQQLQGSESAIKKAHAGDGVAITEPLPVYLLTAAGLDIRTPEKFSQAIEEGSDVPPAVLKQTTDLFDQHQVALLAYDRQNAGPQTEMVLTAARKNGVAVVPVTETLPTGLTYLSWMRGYLDAIAAGLSG